MRWVNRHAAPLCIRDYAKFDDTRLIYRAEPLVFRPRADGALDRSFLFVALDDPSLGCCYFQPAVAVSNLMQRRCRAARFKDVLRATLPDDFAHNPRIHQCYELWGTR